MRVRLLEEIYIRNTNFKFAKKKFSNFYPANIV